MVSTLKKISLRQHVLFYMFIAAFGVIIASYFMIMHYKIEQTKQKLVAIRDKRTSEIEQFLYDNERAIQLVFGQDSVKKALDDIINDFNAQTGNQDIELSKRFSALLTSYKNTLDYKNCLIFDLNGVVIFTDTPVYDHLSVQDQSLRDTALGVSVRQVFMTVTTDIASFSYDSLLKAPALFITVPLFKDKKLQAIAAIRINETTLYAISNNYIGLGVTGDLNIAKRIENGVLYVDRIRNELDAPFKKFTPLLYTSHTADMSPMQMATNGYTGAGVTFDSNHILSLAAWGYVPEAKFGIAAKLSYQEVLKTNAWYKRVLMLLFVVIAILFFIAIIYYKPFKNSLHTTIIEIKKRSDREKFLRQLLKIVWTVSLISSIGCICSFYLLKYNTAAEKKNNIASHIADTQREINRSAYIVELITQTLSYKIKFGYLDNEKLIERLKYYITENPVVSGISVAYAPYAYDKNKRLFGRYVARTANGIETYNLDELYDYTKKSLNDASYKMFYPDSIEEKAVLWTDPTIEPLTKKFVAGCSNDFYTHDGKDLVAVVTVFVDMDSITKRIEAINLGAQGTSFLLSKNGVFLYHPSLNYKENKSTIVEMAQKIASPGLTNLWEKWGVKLHGFYAFKNVAAQDEKEAYFAPLDRTGWLLGIFISKNFFEGSLTSLRHHYVTLLLLILFFVISSLMLLLKIYKPENRTPLRHFLALSAPLLVCFFVLIYICYAQQEIQDPAEHTITTALELEQFITEKKQIAAIINEPAPIPIPTGIQIDSIRPLDKGGLKISGFIWQYYNAIKHKDIKPGVLFTQASNKVDLVKLYETKIGLTTIIGWEFFVEIPYEWNESLYPLDANKISLEIEHPDLSRNILPVPDLAAYQNMNAINLPGLSENVQFSGFNIAESSFSFKNVKPKTTYGVESFGRPTANFSFNFNIIVVRNILNAILIFFLPIFIIMFSIYCFFNLSENHELNLEKTLTAYTGLLLTIIFLHRTMRDQTATAKIMYIEYFFLFTYVTILILTAHIFFQQTDFGKKKWYKKLALWYQSLFWDIQMLIAIILTTVIFY